jgi:hypothetical protein
MASESARCCKHCRNCPTLISGAELRRPESCLASAGPQGIGEPFSGSFAGLCPVFRRSNALIVGPPLVKQSILTLAKELLEQCSVHAPSIRRQSSDLRKNAVIVGQRSAFPVIHEQEQVRSVLLSGEPGRRSQIVAYVQRHPDVCACGRDCQLSAPSLRTAGTSLSRLRQSVSGRQP